jgi:hypothetical protein
LNKKVAAPGLENRDLTAVGTRCADHVTPLYPQKLALPSLTGGGRSVGIVRSRTKATEFSLVSATCCGLVAIVMYIIATE